MNENTKLLSGRKKRFGSASEAILPEAFFSSILKKDSQYPNFAESQVGNNRFSGALVVIFIHQCEQPNSVCLFIFKSWRLAVEEGRLKALERKNAAVLSSSSRFSDSL